MSLRCFLKIVNNVCVRRHHTTAFAFEAIMYNTDVSHSKPRHTSNCRVLPHGEFKDIISESC